MLPNKITKENFSKPSLLLHVFYMYINTDNPVAYVVQYIQIYSSGTVGCLRTNNKSKLNSLRWFRGCPAVPPTSAIFQDSFVY